MGIFTAYGLRLALQFSLYNNNIQILFLHHCYVSLQISFVLFVIQNVKKRGMNLVMRGISLLDFSWTGSCLEIFRPLVFSLVMAIRCYLSVDSLNLKERKNEAATTLWISNLISLMIIIGTIVDLLR